MRETTPIRDFNSCESVKVAVFWGGATMGPLVIISKIFTPLKSEYSFFLYVSVSVSWLGKTE